MLGIKGHNRKKRPKSLSKYAVQLRTPIIAERDAARERNPSDKVPRDSTLSTRVTRRNVAHVHLGDAQLSIQYPKIIEKELCP